MPNNKVKFKSYYRCPIVELSIKLLESTYSTSIYNMQEDVGEIKHTLEGKCLCIMYSS